MIQMLKVIRSFGELDFGQLMKVYEQSNRESGAINYPQLSAGEQQLWAEQDLYSFLQCFFREREAFYAIWEPAACYVAALRMEPYRDGLLLEALETTPEYRRKGYATALVRAVLLYLEAQGTVKVYSHVSRKNAASLAVHRACGFEKYLDHAVYVDGSVSRKACTYQFSIK